MRLRFASRLAAWEGRASFRKIGLYMLSISLGVGSLVEAGIDDVRVLGVSCTDVCPSDVDGDGVLNFFDVLGFLALADAGDPAADFDGSSSFDAADVSKFVGSFGAGCP